MIHKFEGEYRFLSNFWAAPILWSGVTWPTAEHAYQAAKFNDPKKTEKILSDPDPKAAKKVGKSKNMRPDWEDVKVPLMREIVNAKFNQHPTLLEHLKMTAPHELVEGNWWGDRFWGQSPVGHGENWLGKILMEIRDKS